MEIICPACGAHYRISVDTVGAKGRSFICHSCDHVWRVMPPLAGGGETLRAERPVNGPSGPRCDAAERVPAATEQPAFQESGTFTYIAAWLCAVIPANLAGHALSTAMFSGVGGSRDDIATTVIIGTALEYAIVVGFFMLSYSLFRHLVLCKVMAWVWVLGILGIVVGLFAVPSMGVKMQAVFIWPQIVFGLAALFAIRVFFKSTGRWDPLVAAPAAVRR